MVFDLDCVVITNFLHSYIGWSHACVGSSSFTVHVCAASLNNGNGKSRVSWLRRGSGSSAASHTLVWFRPLSLPNVVVTATAASLSISQLATALGANMCSLLRDETKDLLMAGRGTNGCRHFSASAVAQVRQLQSLLGAGFSLAEIRGFPDCMRLIEGAQACPETSAAQRERLESLERQIGEPQSRRARLLQMLRESEGPAA